MVDLEVNCKDGEICQIGLVVYDLKDSVRRYWHELGLGPWYIWKFAQPELKEVYYRGAKLEHSGFKLALAKIGPMQYELLQPLYGFGIHQEHLDRKGEGLHHMKIYYKDISTALEKYKNMGIFPIQQGKYKDDWYVYLDTEDRYGLIYEIGNAGDIGEPLMKYPD